MVQTTIEFTEPVAPEVHESTGAHEALGLITDRLVQAKENIGAEIRRITIDLIPSKEL